MNEKIFLCVTGGIAAYKAIDLASMLVKHGYIVKPLLTDAARQFVCDLSFRAITHSPVYANLFEDPDPIPHIALADWADLVVVAPATANVMAKAAHGIADDLLGAILLAHRKPVLWVPAMNVNMYEHPATQSNMAVLRDRGNHILEPSTGALACGYSGKGKYPPNEEILFALRCFLRYGEDLRGKKVLVTAGATSESIDPMRVISNRSSGQMGIALARACALRGASTTLVHGELAVSIPHYLEQVVYAPGVDEMAEAVLRIAPASDIIIKCAAVSDYKPEKQSMTKIKKSADLSLNLVRTRDILRELGQIKQSFQILVGFAAETENLEENARKKLQSKNLDLICANHLNTVEKDETELTLIKRAEGKNNQFQSTVIKGDKFSAALSIVDEIRRL